MVDRCFELLKNHYSRDSIKGKLVQVSVACSVKDGRRTNENFKEILELRKRGWEGLPPPPGFTSTKAELAGAGKEDASAPTPTVTPLGLPSTYLEEPQAEVAQPRPMESIAAQSETETIHGSPATVPIHQQRNSFRLHHSRHPRR